MAALLVCRHDLAHVRVDPGSDVPHEEPLAEFVEFAKRLPFRYPAARTMSRSNCMRPSRYLIDASRTPRISPTACLRRIRSPGAWAVAVKPDTSVPSKSKKAPTRVPAGSRRSRRPDPTAPRSCPETTVLDHNQPDCAGDRSVDDDRKESAISPRRRKTLSASLIILLLLVCAGSFPSFGRPQQPPDRIELSDGWQLASATQLGADGATVSRAGYAAPGWHKIRRMPATVLEALQDDGTYPDLYYGKNLLDEVPQDLYKQDWWYRTSFKAPAGHTTYLLELPGINYRAEIWLNGHMVADNTQIVGMHNAHELDVARWILPGQPNTLAIKVTPERSLQDINGVELADSWWDWINWNYLGYQGPGKNPDRGNSFVSDRNAGIWKPVYLKVAGEVSLGSAVVNTELPLPRTDSARLTIHTSVHNYRPGKSEGC